MLLRRLETGVNDSLTPGVNDLDSDGCACSVAILRQSGANQAAGGFSDVASGQIETKNNQKNQNVIDRVDRVSKRVIFC